MRSDQSRPRAGRRAGKMAAATPAPSPAPSDDGSAAHGTASYGSDFVHNTDIDPPPGYLETVPRVRAALRFPALLEEFRACDAVANAKLWRLRAMGWASLVLGVVSLLGITGKLLAYALSDHSVFTRNRLYAIEACAIASVVLALAPLFFRTRSRWLTARFMTEQMRLWHFQTLLDGALVSRAHSAPEAFEAERMQRWKQFLARAASAQGAMTSFIEGATLRFNHAFTRYPDEETAREAAGAYVDLRFEKQLAYFKLKRDEFKARDEWSEAIARWALFTAVLLAVTQIGLLLVSSDPPPPHAAGQTASHTLSACLAAGALVMVIVSAATRVYRDAIAVAQQRDRYDSKWIRLVALQAAFDTASTIDGKLEIMREVEAVELDELREFLGQMCYASYLL